MQRGHPYPMQQLFPNASRIEALRIFKFFFRPFLSFIFIYFHPPRTSARTHVHNDTQFARNSGDYTSDSTIKGRRKLVVKL